MESMVNLFPAKPSTKLCVTKPLGAGKPECGHFAPDESLSERAAFPVQVLYATRSRSKWR